MYTSTSDAAHLVAQTCYLASQPPIRVNNDGPQIWLTLMTSKTCFALGRFQGSSSRHCSMSVAILVGQSSIVRARIWPRLGIWSRDDMVG